MSVDKIRLRNFRGLKEVSLDLKPLTVLLGPNSSGKSSFSNPLAALVHCQQLFGGRRDASLTPEDLITAESWPTDLGGYPDLVTTGCKEKVYIGLRTSEGWVEYGFGNVQPAPDKLLLSHIAYPQNVNVTGTSHLPEEHNADNLIPTSAPSSKATVNVEIEANQSPISEEEPKLVLVRINEQQWEHEGNVLTPGLDGLIPLVLQHLGGTEIVLNRTSVNEIRSFLKDTLYLRASRYRPMRGYGFSINKQKSLGYDGKKTANVLFNLGGQQEAYISPPPPASNIDNGDIRVSWEVRNATLGDAVGKWLAHLRLAQTVEVVKSQRYPECVDVRLKLRSGWPSRDITEVGFAISQVLPVIVGALLQSEGSLFIVDMPEAHLHPSSQEDMADLFCALAMHGRLSLVETHSERFFHRLRLRAEMDTDLRKRIAVYFVDGPNEKGECSYPREIGLDFEEELSWPAGFLQEGLDSAIRIRLVRQSRKKDE